jgi:hypothetical protein
MRKFLGLFETDPRYAGARTVAWMKDRAFTGLRDREAAGVELDFDYR